MYNKTVLENTNKYHYNTDFQVAKNIPTLLPMSLLQCSGDITTLKFTRNTSTQDLFTDTGNAGNSKQLWSGKYTRINKFRCSEETALFLVMATEEIYKQFFLQKRRHKNNCQRKIMDGPKHLCIRSQHHMPYSWK